MKFNILLSIIFITVIFYGSVEYSHGIVGLTKLNGDGCVCHNITPDQNVSVWIEGPDSVQVNQTVTYRVYLTGGPQIAGGFNVATRTGNLLPGDSTSQKIDLELTHTTPKVFSGDTVYWQFSYTAPSSVLWDTIYSVAQSVNLDGIPNSQDKWNFGPDFVVKVVPFVPVELISFTASAGENSINLSWSTGSEMNNSGFEIERKGSNENEWESLAFIKGNNSVIRRDYYYCDNSPLNGKSNYRLKQIDYDGKFTYSNPVEISIDLLLNNFELLQNYPNPFNPSTRIKFIIPDNSAGNFVSLKVYDISGKLVSVLFEGQKKPGVYEAEFNASSLSSGVYFYTLQALPTGRQAGNFSESRKMILLK